MGNNNNDDDIGQKQYSLMPRRHSSGAFELSPNNNSSHNNSKTINGSVNINNHYYYYHRRRRDSSPRRITAFYPITTSTVSASATATNIHSNYNHFGNHNRTLFINDLVNRRQSMPLMMNNSVSLFPVFFSNFYRPYFFYI